LDKEFIEEIEKLTPAGSMVFQLPFVRYNHIDFYKNMGTYDHYYPFIHSKTLKWSYRAPLFSAVERWQMLVAGSTVDNMLKHLAGVGFAGVYLDKFGYDSDEYNKLRNSIIKITGIEPITSKNKRMEYLYLGEYFENMKKGFNVAEKKIYENWNINTINVPFGSLICYGNAEVINNNIEIHKNGFQRGPFISLGKGRYIVSVKGNNLLKAEPFVVNSYEQKEIPAIVMGCNDYEISYTFEAYKNLDGVEFVLYNPSEENIILFGYELEIIE